MKKWKQEKKEEGQGEKRHSLCACAMASPPPLSINVVSLLFIITTIIIVALPYTISFLCALIALIGRCCSLFLLAGCFSLANFTLSLAVLAAVVAACCRSLFVCFLLLLLLCERSWPLPFLSRSLFLFFFLSHPLSLSLSLSCDLFPLLILDEKNQVSQREGARERGGGKRKQRQRERERERERDRKKEMFIAEQ